MIFFLRSIFPQLLLNAFIVYRICKSRYIGKSLKWILSSICVAELIVYLTGLFFSFRLPVDVFTMIQKVSGAWVIFQGYLTVLILLFDFISYLSRNKGKQAIIRRMKPIAFVCMVLFICLQFYWGYCNFIHPVVKTYGFSFNKPDPADNKPSVSYKMLVVSDFHLGYIVDSAMLKLYVDLINRQHADLVVIDGDLVDFSLRPLIEENMDEILREIQAPKGVFFVPGNHEYKFNSEDKLSWISNTGIIVLKDSVASIDDRLFLVGRKDRSQKDRMPIEDLLKKTDAKSPCIVITHHPGDIPESYNHNVPLTICGHTHRGQVFPGNLAACFLYPNSYGLQVKGEKASYTTSGLGLSGFPLRVGSRSEIVVFNIDI